MTTCPTCGRRPSWRIGNCGYPHHDEATSVCLDPIHDLADRAPEELARLRRLLDAASEYLAHSVRCASDGDGTHLTGCTCDLDNLRRLIENERTTISAGPAAEGREKG